MTYDALIIGAGMSGLAAAIRLAMFDQKVLLIEKHSEAGGLNSFFHRKFEHQVQNQSLRIPYAFDVGLHALTNFSPKKNKKAPLNKLLRQLRLAYDDLKLDEQTYSSIDFEEKKINFSNDFNLLKSQIEQLFPHSFESFMRFHEDLMAFDELSLDHRSYQSSREKLATYIDDQDLIEMLMCPLLIYGSAWAHDMDFSQFVVMYKALYLEGFARPRGGVRTLIDLLLKRAQEVGVDIQFRKSLTHIDKDHDGDFLVSLKHQSEKIKVKKIFSSAGLLETFQMINPSLIEHNPHYQKVKNATGKMTFLECMMLFEGESPFDQNDPTIVFYNEGPKYDYGPSDDFYDPRSAVVCLPENYHSKSKETQEENSEINPSLFQVRVTYIANYDLFQNLRDQDKKAYRLKKEEALKDALHLVKKKFKPLDQRRLVYSDVFTPATVKRYTGHHKGVIYGHEYKVRDGHSGLEGLYIIGTDQGFLGIVGALLSGISIANLYGLQND